MVWIVDPLTCFGTVSRLAEIVLKISDFASAYTEAKTKVVFESTATYAYISVGEDGVVDDGYVAGRH